MSTLVEHSRRMFALCICQLCIHYECKTSLYKVTRLTNLAKSLLYTTHAEIAVYLLLLLQQRCEPYILSWEHQNRVRLHVRVYVHACHNLDVPYGLEYKCERPAAGHSIRRCHNLACMSPVSLAGSHQQPSAAFWCMHTSATMLLETQVPSHATSLVCECPTMTSYPNTMS